MRVAVDFTRCEGHGLCVGEAPEVFDLDDFGNLQVLDDRPPPSMRDAIEGARLGCPVAAITVDG